MTNNTDPSLTEAKVRLNRSQVKAHALLTVCLYSFGWTCLWIGLILASFVYRSDGLLWLATIVFLASAVFNGLIARYYVDAQADYAIQKMQFSQNFPSAD